jgi:hypothetical protein
MAHHKHHRRILCQRCRRYEALYSVLGRLLLCANCAEVIFLAPQQSCLPLHAKEMTQ